jgi:hypothetical protein
LAHCILFRLPQYFIQRETGHAFIDGMRCWEVKFSILMGSDMTLDKALSQTLRLEAAKETSVPPARQCVISAAAPLESQFPGTDSSRTGWPVCWQYRGISHLRRDCRQGCPQKDFRGGWRVEDMKRKMLVPSCQPHCYTFSMLTRKIDGRLNAERRISKQVISHDHWHTGASATIARPDIIAGLPERELTSS